jgi:hypothetical protein
MQKLRDSERDLIVSTAQRNAEVAKLRVTIEDQSKSEEERLKAAQRATALQRQTIEEEKALAQERVDIIQAQLALSENLEEDEQRLADAKAMRFQVEERATTRLVELNNKEVQLRKQIAAEKEKATASVTGSIEKEIETDEERQKKIEEGYQEERRLIDQQAELKKAQAEIEIANAEERAERIAFIEREALFEKLRSIEDETAAYTASADMVGAVDEKKYAKQLAERAKYEAELAAIDREAKADEFNREMELLQGREELANQQAEIETENKLAGIDRELQAEINAINSSKKSEENKEKAITKAEQKAAKERYRIEVQQFKTAKALQIALAVANTATAVMAQLSNPTPYAGFVLAALAAATGAVQIATISSQKPPPPPAFATGGKVLGAGTGTSDSIPARLSNGEAVINAKSTKMFEPMLSAMNAAGGGVDWYNGGGYAKGGLVQKFAAGGVARSSGVIMRENEAARELQQTIVQSPPVLVLEEFQNVQGRQVRTEQNLQI